MKKILNILIIVYLIFSNSCSEDFVQVANENEIDAANFFNRVEDFELALTGVYSSVKTFELYGSDFLVKGLYGLPHTADQDWLGHNVWNQLYRNEVTSDNGVVQEFWRGWWRVVGRANDFIENADKFLANDEKSASQKEQIELMKGQAHFLRAFAYFHMVRLWGEDNPARNANAKGIQLVLKVPTSREDMFISRNTVGEIYDQIEADFTTAEQILPESWDDADIARVTSYAAKGYLGKVALYQEDYQSAINYFEEIINNNDFDLVDWENYEGMFHGENEFSEESLFEINFSEDLAENTWDGGLGSNVALLIAPKGTGWSNVYPHDVNIQRFGSDPRLRVNALEPGVDSVVTGDGEKVPLQVFVPDEDALGWSFKKYVPLDYSVYASNRNYGANIVMMRLADIYLMYAEALNASGQDGEAAEYMNKVRRRAYGFDPDTPETSVDYTGLAGDQLRDSIREERFRELFAEGHRWYDIVRWDIADKEAAKYPKVRSGEIIFNNPHDNYLPIPVSELETNTKMTQSNGY